MADERTRKQGEDECRKESRGCDWWNEFHFFVVLCVMDGVEKSNQFQPQLNMSCPFLLNQGRLLRVVPNLGSSVKCGILKIYIYDKTITILFYTFFMPYKHHVIFLWIHVDP